MDEFLEKIIDIVDSEQEILPETRLEDIKEWDSLSIVSFLAMTKVEYGKNLRKADFAGAETVRDLYDILMRK